MSLGRFEALSMGKKYPRLLFPGDSSPKMLMGADFHTRYRYTSTLRVGGWGARGINPQLFRVSLEHTSKAQSRTATDSPVSDRPPGPPPVHLLG